MRECCVIGRDRRALSRARRALVLGITCEQMHKHTKVDGAPSIDALPSICHAIMSTLNI